MLLVFIYWSSSLPEPTYSIFKICIRVTYSYLFYSIAMSQLKNNGDDLIKYLGKIYKVDFDFDLSQSFNFLKMELGSKISLLFPNIRPLEIHSGQIKKVQKCQNLNFRHEKLLLAFSRNSSWTGVGVTFGPPPSPYQNSSNSNKSIYYWVPKIMQCQGKVSGALVKVPFINLISTLK